MRNHNIFALPIVVGSINYSTIIIIMKIRQLSYIIYSYNIFNLLIVFNICIFMYMYVDK